MKWSDRSVAEERQPLYGEETGAGWAKDAATRAFLETSVLTSIRLVAIIVWSRLPFEFSPALDSVINAWSLF